MEVTWPHSLRHNANKMFGLLCRSFNCLDIKTSTCLYKTMVKTHLDYAIQYGHLTKLNTLRSLRMFREGALDNCLT